MMNQYVTRSSVVALLAAVLSAGSAVADDKAHDFYFQQNQRRFPAQVQNARTFGQGGSSFYTTSDSSSVVGNPAGLGLMKYGDVSASYGYQDIGGHQFPGGNSIYEKENSGSVMGAIPLGPVKDSLPDYGNFGFAYTARSGDWAKDTQNTDSDTYQIALGYGAALTNSTSIGYSLTYNNDQIQSNVYDYNQTNGFLHNVGIQSVLSDDLKIGGSFLIGHGSHNASVYRTGQSETVDQLSVGFTTGASYKVADNTTLSSAIDYTHYDNNGEDVIRDPSIVWGGDSYGNSANFRLGVEQQINDWLALRAGYRYAGNFRWDYDRAELQDLNGSAKYNAWSAGIGFNYDFGADSMIRAVRLDYGAEYRAVGDNDWQHIATVSAPFDLCK